MTLATFLAMRYTLDFPPPDEPPAELGLRHGRGLGIWRAMVQQWRDHAPVTTDRGEHRCAYRPCSRVWPCWGFSAAQHVLDRLHSYPEGEGLTGYDRLAVVLVERVAPSLPAPPQRRVRPR